MQKLNLAHTLHNSEGLTPDFNLHRPLLDGFPDAAILAIEEHYTPSPSQRNIRPISVRDVVVVSLAAENVSKTLFSDVCFPERSRTRPHDARVTVADVVHAVEVFTTAALADAPRLPYHAHFHVVREEDAGTTLIALPRSTAAGRVRSRSTMLTEVRNLASPADSTASVVEDVQVPTIRSHFQVVDVLMRVAVRLGVAYGLNVWRLLPSGDPDTPFDAVEYALRDTGQPIPGQNALPYFRFLFGSNRQLPVSARYRLCGAGGFSVFVYAPDKVKPGDLEEAVRAHDEFWQREEHIQTFDKLVKLHQVAVTMMVVSLKWEGLVEMSAGDVMHRVCCSMPDFDESTPGIPMNEIEHILDCHRKTVAKLAAAANFNREDVKNVTLMKKNAQHLLNSADTAKYVEEMELSKSIHKRAQGIVMEREPPEGQTVSDQEILEDVLVPRVKDVHRALYQVIARQSRELKLPNKSYNLDLEYATVLMKGKAPVAEEDQKPTKRVQLVVDKQGYLCGTSLNAICLTLCAPQQALVVYNLCAEYLTTDACVKQPVSGEFDTLDRVKANLLAAAVDPRRDGGCGTSQRGLQRALKDLHEGIPTMLANSRKNVRTTFERMLDAEKTELKWSAVKQWMEEYDKEHDLKLKPWVFREVFSILYYVLDGNFEVVNEATSFLALFKNTFKEVGKRETHCGKLIVDTSVPAGGIMCSRNSGFTKSSAEIMFKLTEGEGDLFKVEEQAAGYVCGPIEYNCSMREGSEIN